MTQERLVYPTRGHRGHIVHTAVAQRLRLPQTLLEGVPLPLIPVHPPSRASGVQPRRPPHIYVRAEPPDEQLSFPPRLRHGKQIHGRHGGTIAALYYPTVSNNPLAPSPHAAPTDEPPPNRRSSLCRVALLWDTSRGRAPRRFSGK